MPNQSNLDLNCTYTPTDIQNLKCNLNCDLNSIHSSSDSKLINSTDNQQCVRVSSIDKTKITTDAERLKRMLLNEKSNESKKIDKKYSSLKKVSNESLKLNQEINKISNQSINQINNVKTNHSPASSSAETRLINSRIAALSSASHLLNLDTYGRLTAPTINDNLAVAVVANPTNPLNFLLPNNNLSSNLSVANSLPVSNNEINLHPNQLLPHVHQLPLQTPNTIASSLSNNNLTNVNMSISLNNSLPKQQVVLNSQISLPSNIHQLTSSTMQPSTIHFDTKQWNEIVSTPILNQSIQSANLIQSNLSHQPVPLPSLIENSQFPNNINSLSSEILMANMKKSFNHQPKKNRPKKFICTVGQCDSSFANNGQLKNHIRSHTGKFQLILNF